ncbi:MAG: CPBP family intramembrane metalloprotease [Alphaproteobacteria bacterium]
MKDFEQRQATSLNMPWWYIVLMIIVFGFAKEILFCGFVIERLSSITGHMWMACLISTAALTIAYVPNWGWDATPSTFSAGLIAVLLYAWFRDLTPLIVAHITTNIVGYVLMEMDKQNAASALTHSEDSCMSALALCLCINFSKLGCSLRLDRCTSEP